MSDVDDMMHEIAASLREVIEDTETAALESDPEQTFVDLACRFVLRLSKTLTILPTAKLVGKVFAGQIVSSPRISDIFTRWMKAHPERSYSVRLGASGRFEVVVKDGVLTRVFFGSSEHDARAQATQTLVLEETYHDP